MILIPLAILFGAVILLFIIVSSWYVIVPTGEAHLVISSGARKIFCADEKVSDDGNVYFAVPSFLPKVGRSIRVIDLTIKELTVPQEVVEKNQARYHVQSSLKYKVSDVITAANTFVDEENVKTQLVDLVMAAVRAVTVKYDVTEARASKQKMTDEIDVQIKEDLAAWGLSLVNFQLVDFKDTVDSQIISNISRRREVEIESTTRQENADKLRVARTKEAEAEEGARIREITRDQMIAEQQQKQQQKVAEQSKVTQEKEYEVLEVKALRQADIDRKKFLIETDKELKAEEIRKQQKQLAGLGDRLQKEEIAKGDAAGVREKGLAEAEIAAAMISQKGAAEAEAKELLQAALNKFGDVAIRALVAERIVAMQETVGIATADALKNADVRLFSGSSAGQSGFDLGQLLGSMSVSNQGVADAVLNRLAQPHDLGFAKLDKPESGKKISKT